MLMYTLSNPNCMPMSPLKILTLFIIDSCSFLFLAYIFRSSSKVSSVPMCTSLTKGSRFAQSVFPVQFSLPMVQHMQTKNNVISNGQVTTIRRVKEFVTFNGTYSLMAFYVISDGSIISLTCITSRHLVTS